MVNPLLSIKLRVGSRFYQKLKTHLSQAPSDTMDNKMQKARKRKQAQTQTQTRRPTKIPTKSLKTSDAIESKTTANSAVQPYPSHPRPTPEECRSVRDDLLSLHGFPEQFAKYRRLRTTSLPGFSSKKSNLLDGEDDDDDGGGGGSHSLSESLPEESVLDGLVSTILSQNTTDVNSQRAFASLKSAFPTWGDVLDAELKSIENAIRCGGLAVTKASCIKNILRCLLEKKGKLCLEYLRDLPIDEIKAELSHFKGIGPKTVACVLLFNLQHDDFPVDTHVFQIAKAIGWVPAEADTKKTYLHLNHRIPNELKFDLNCLLFSHGKLCHKCTEKGGNQQRGESHENSCPLVKYCKNSDSLSIGK